MSSYLQKNVVMLVDRNGNPTHSLALSVTMSGSYYGSNEEENLKRK